MSDNSSRLTASAWGQLVVFSIAASVAKLSTAMVTTGCHMQKALAEYHAGGALVRAVPAILETNNLVRDDGKRLDGMSIFPWKMGRSLVWDATLDAIAPTHLPSANAKTGSPASKTAGLKRSKYENLSKEFFFVLFGV